ncbi:Transcription accessory protein [Mycoplasmopsis meleagridis]|uniref:Transcription accessory protein (S1 RNA-binding domain) n=1 Tax=Mycoplasmopsis meleagridis ATCC 25294 TaxID=1264554 RepID=A0A0F5H0G1_9BACT|nr:Tex-like N-terminal domain-containing protein [Mycoplasmopsis meleagridis]KKB26769.1 Transcription accessory protein (S1 RNA-binding domain) [Mycoplasmopsis meleagridis ATCC 25294]OAD18115.1 Transcription accessory protein [Mycoplasmopsis meleagridis]VEU77303.1 RNA (S1 domain)-binding protein [Mycoplasmopsis meleagridis]
MNISITNVAKQMNLKESQVETVLNMLSEGSTVPFIARYRQAQTEGLNEEQIQEINVLYQYDVELNKRKETILGKLEEAKLLTEELKNQINNVTKKSELENIYEPFKVGKKTKATEAISLGLEPLAKIIFDNEDPKFNPYKEAQKYINENVKSVEFAIEQAQYIISQWISQDVNTREFVKEVIKKTGFIITKKKKNAIDENENFVNYYEHKEKLSYIPNHRVLAINRAENKKIISYDIEFNEKMIKYELNNKYFKVKTTGNIIKNSLLDALERLIYPSIIREIKNDLFEKAEEQAIKIFAEQIEAMLMWPAVKGKKILSIDPGYGHGCKMAVLDENGKLLATQKMYPNIPQKETIKSEKIVNDLINKYEVDIIVIGNGTASRETEEFIANLIQKRKQLDSSKKIGYAIVSEIGASVYSASQSAIEEFPNLSVEERSAVNIGRKFQDPLNELIKIDPKSIGVGQYQHDLNQKELSKNLDFKVDKVVNLVGIDINTATKDILVHISGLNKKTAENIVSYREKNKFNNRQEVKNVKGLGEKAYEQAIGFLRIHDSKNFFDRTSIHPENYELAYKIVEYLNLDLNNIDKNIINKQDLNELSKKFNDNSYNIKQILESLLNPTKDVRDSKEGYKIKDSILTIDDLKEGMKIDASVLNITDFAIFAYVGLKESAFIHKSSINYKNNSDFDIHSLFKPGDNLEIIITEIDKEKNKIKAKIDL